MLLSGNVLYAHSAEDCLVSYNSIIRKSSHWPELFLFLFINTNQHNISFYFIVQLLMSVSTRKMSVLLLGDDSNRSLAEPVSCSWVHPFEAVDAVRFVVLSHDKVMFFQSFGTEGTEEMPAVVLGILSINASSLCNRLVTEFTGRSVHIWGRC